MNSSCSQSSCGNNGSSVGTDHHVSDGHVTSVCFWRDAGVGAKFTELL